MFVNERDKILVKAFFIERRPVEKMSKIWKNIGIKNEEWKKKYARP